MDRDRLDRVLVSRGLVETREEAIRLILAGSVKVDGVCADKQGKQVPTQAQIEIAERAPFVSRAGGKLAGALDAFGIDPLGWVAMDVGASTGGFTDCLLQRGARRVYAIDVGYGLIDWKLRQDARVVLLERTNIRYVVPEAIPELVDLVVIDVSFISLRLVLPSVLRFLRPTGRLVVLVKPQFEVGRGQVGRGGIVRDDEARYQAVRDVMTCASELGLSEVGVVESPVQVKKGNREILLGLQWASQVG